ncbi:MAG: hypothetical protein QXU75_06045 [Candidatus Methanomethylicaceae archaeon]
MNATNVEQTKEQIANHLQFLGYEVTREEKYVRARHPRKPNLIVQVYPEGILHTAIWATSGNAKINREGFLEYLNTLNENAKVVRYYADKDLDLFVEGWYTGGYERTNYSRFLELWDADFEKLAGMPETERYLK